MSGQLREENELQERNRLWWDRNPMSYDWCKTIAAPEGTREFFEEIDARFLQASAFCGGERAFARLIPFDDLKGKRVLEIGCGLGCHAQLLAEAGCILTAIDLTPRAVELTRKRLSLKGITADVRVMDAEQMELEDEQFDFVWSWGVVHHSASPARIVREAYRVLKPSGEFRLMVYHRRSLCAYINVVRGVLSGKLFQGLSVAGILNSYSDGYIARFYTRSELLQMIRSCGFSKVSIQTLGQTSDLIPLPGSGPGGRLKSALLSVFPNALAERVLSRIGSFLFAIAVKNEDGSPGLLPEKGSPQARGSPGQA